MQPAEAGRRVAGGRQERRGVAAARQIELRLLPDPHVGVAEQLDTPATGRLAEIGSFSSVCTSLRTALPAAAGVSSFQIRPLSFESQPVIQSVR